MYSVSSLLIYATRWRGWLSPCSSWLLERSQCVVFLRMQSVQAKKRPFSTTQCNSTTTISYYKQCMPKKKKNLHLVVIVNLQSDYSKWQRLYSIRWHGTRGCHVLTGACVTSDGNQFDVDKVQQNMIEDKLFSLWFSSDLESLQVKLSAHCLAAHQSQ